MGAVLHLSESDIACCAKCSWSQWTNRLLCKRRAPLPIANGRYAAAEWPETRSDDWCGEFAKRGA